MRIGTFLDSLLEGSQNPARSLIQLLAVTPRVVHGRKQGQAIASGFNLLRFVARPFLVRAWDWKTPCLTGLLTQYARPYCLLTTTP